MGFIPLAKPIIALGYQTEEELLGWSRLSIEDLKLVVAQTDIQGRLHLWESDQTSS